MLLAFYLCYTVSALPLWHVAPTIQYPMAENCLIHELTLCSHGPCYISHNVRIAMANHKCMMRRQGWCQWSPGQEFQLC